MVLSPFRVTFREFAWTDCIFGATGCQRSSRYCPPAARPARRQISASPERTASPCRARRDELSHPSLQMELAFGQNPFSLTLPLHDTQQIAV